MTTGWVNNQKHILVAEDSPTQAVKLEILLQKAGYKVTLAANGRAALIAALEDPPNLIISDVVMPQMSGYEFCGEAKKSDRLKDVPFIILTTLNETSDIIQGLKVGTDYYVTKPYGASFLIKKITSIFEQPEGGDGHKFEVVVEGERHQIDSSRQQMFNLLLSTYENALIQNLELQQTKNKLDKTNQELTQNIHELELSEGRFSSLVQTIPDIVYRLDAEGKFIFINKAIERLGFSTEEIIGAHFSKIIFPPEVDRVSRDKVLPKFIGRHTGAEDSPKLFDERRAGARKTSGLEVRLLIKGEDRLSSAQINALDDQGLMVEVNSAGFHGPDRQGSMLRFLGTVGVIRDITSRKKLENELAKAYRESEARVIERTAELRRANRKLKSEIDERSKAEEQARRVQEQLFQSQKLEAIGTLAGGIAHDFNNMLAAILGYSELAQEDASGNSQLSENLENITSAAMRARDLVQQILSFSRQTERETIPLKLPPLISETMKLLRASLPATIEIIRDVREDGGLVLADPIQIHQLLMNLSTNAAQAMEEKGGTLSIKLEPAEYPQGRATDFGYLEPGKYQKLSVADDGPGIEGVVLKKIFEPFYTTKEVGKGTGMGLSVVHGITADLGGLITVESQPGKGTVFELFLPVAKHQALHRIKQKEIGNLKGTERILFVDDEVDLVDIGKTALSRLGYEVTGLTSSTLALEVFKAKPGYFDLVITDYTMPKMTGVELAKTILSLEPGIPIIMCTGFSEQMSAEKAKEAGISKFVMKPLLPRKAAQVIREVLKSQAKGAEK